jgi:alpha-glucosidase
MNMNKLKKLIILIVVSHFSLTLNAQQYELNSPGNLLSATIKVDQGIEVSMTRQGRDAVKLSNISLDFKNSGNEKPNWKVQRTARNSINETVIPEIKEKSASIQNSYNELEIKFRDNKAITFRLFDEGLAYRLSTSAKDSLIILSESLSLQFEALDSVRFQASKTFNSSYETPYEHKEITGIEAGSLLHLPLLVEKKNGLMVMVTEADLYNYPGLWLNGNGGAQFTATHPPYPAEYRKTGSIYGHGQVAATNEYIARVNGTRTYPWRIFGVADDEKELVDNNMVYLLATPNVIDDVSWIKPGVVMFDWWAKNNVYGVDFKAGINTETAKYFIDFCAEYGFRYFLFDDGWCPKEDLLSPVEGLDMEEVTSYAKTRGVDVMLWVIWHALEKQWDQAFDLFEKWGIKGIKMDFMNRDDQPMVEFYEAVARKAAEKKMVVNYHGAYKPCGLRRKYPNVLTREALIEFEYNGWTNQANPEHHNLLPYIRMFTGPMDYIPATMRNSTRDNFRPVGDYPMGIGTRAHAMALWVVLNSPMTMLPDSPSDYYREKECTEFLARLPVVWDETRLLEGKISEYTVMARRSGDNWYVGAITGWDARTIELGTDFLLPGKYRIEAIEDGVNAHQRAEDYRKTERELQAGETVKVSLAPGGGWVARIVPVK